MLSVTSSVALLPSPTTIASISSAVAYSTGLYNLSPSSFIMVGGTASPSDVVYHLDDITISNINSNSYYAIPEVLTWSISGATSIYFSYSSDKNNPVPSWASVDSTNNKLLFNTPSITSDTSYSFTLAVNTSQDSTLFYSNVYVNVKYVPVVWTVPNWSTWSQTNGSICTTWNSGYQLSADYQSWTQTSSGSASQVGLIIILASAGVSSLHYCSKFCHHVLKMIPVAQKCHLSI